MVSPALLVLHVRRWHRKSSRRLIYRNMWSGLLFVLAVGVLLQSLQICRWFHMVQRHLKLSYWAWIEKRMEWSALWRGIFYLISHYYSNLPGVVNLCPLMKLNHVLITSLLHCSFMLKLVVLLSSWCLCFSVVYLNMVFFLWRQKPSFMWKCSAVKNLNSACVMLLASFSP